MEVKQGSTTLATFVYDGAGRRVEKSASGLTHTYVYDAEDIVEERLSGSGSIRYYHGVGVDEPLARKNSTDVVTYYLPDHLGSIVQETEATGDVTLDREYDPWGNLLQGESSAGFAFTGREWDSEVSLYYYRARYYQASTARFISEDPAGLAAGLNLSGYVSGTPTNRIDPFGLCPPPTDQDQNRLDRLYRELATRPDLTTLDRATREIARRAGPMGELDTYAQLVGLALLGHNLAGTQAGVILDLLGLQIAVTYPKTFDFLVDSLNAIAPLLPTTTREKFLSLAQLIFERLTAK